MARRPAAVRQPARREQPALPALPAPKPARTPATTWTRSGCRRSGCTQFEDYVDAQSGGPGKGWYRIVTNPWQARRVINAGKLAVVMGIETSVPFGCTFKASPARRPGPALHQRRSTGSSTRCTRLGVRQMELVNKFDNALSGVAGDEGADRRRGQQRQLPRDRQLLGHAALRPGRRPAPTTANQVAAARDRARAAGRAVRRDRPGLRRSLGPLPLYPPPDHCNRRGLTDLGEHLVDRLARHRHADRPRPHERLGPRRACSTASRSAATAACISSHSWSTPDAYPRIYKLGGFIAPYAGDSTGFVEKWRRHLEWADTRYYFGFGYGADMNGLGAQGDPRGADVAEPGDLPVPRARRRDHRPQAAPASGSTTSTSTASRSTASTPTGSRTCARSPTASGATASDRDRHGARRRGLPADVGAGDGRGPDSCRNPGLRTRVAAFRDSGADRPAGARADAAGRAAVPAPGPDLHLLHPHRSRPGRPRAGRAGPQRPGGCGAGSVG